VSATTSSAGPCSTPRGWDYQTRREFDREVRKALEEEYKSGMTQDDADEIAFEVLDEWLDGDEDA